MVLLDMKLILAFAGFVTSYSPVLIAAEASAPFNQNSCAPRAADNLDIMRIATLSESASPREFCNNQMAKRFLLSSYDRPKTNGGSETVRGLNDVEIEKLRENGKIDSEMENRIGEALTRDGWEKTLVPTAKSKEDGMRESILLPHLLRRGANGGNGKSTNEVLESAMKVLDEKSPCAFERNYAPYLYDLNEVSDLKEERGSIAEATGGWLMTQPAYLKACTDVVGLLKANSCRKNTAAITAQMFPRVGGRPMASLYHEFFTNAAYDEPIRDVARTLIKRFRDPQPDSSANLFDDTKSAFLKHGFNEDQATEASFRLLGLISGGGANMKNRLSQYRFAQQKWPAVTGITTIAALLPALDSKYAGSGHLYSYPSSVKTHCDHAKPYHFWGAAYLARHAAQQTGEPETSASAAFVASKGYQIFSTSGGRKPGSILKLGTFSPAANVLRMDLVYSAAGAVFGASSSVKKSTSLDVDSGLQNLVGSAGNHRPFTPEQVDAATSGLGTGNYNAFHEMFSPDVALNLFQKTGPITGAPSRPSLPENLDLAQCPSP